MSRSHSVTGDQFGTGGKTIREATLTFIRVGSRAFVYVETGSRTINLSLDAEELSEAIQTAMQQ